MADKTTEKRVNTDAVPANPTQKNSYVWPKNLNYIKTAVKNNQLKNKKNSAEKKNGKIGVYGVQIN